MRGTLQQKLDVMSGEGRNGPWQKQDFILETGDRYPKKVCVTLWGDKVNELERLNEGQELNVHFDVESREYNGRWYTDVKAWKIESLGDAPPAEQVPPRPADEPFDVDDDLPF